MKPKSRIYLFFLILTAEVQGMAQNPVINISPEGTLLLGNIPYNNDTLEKHLLDIYLPEDAIGTVPLVIFIHGGGWLDNDKYADMGYMRKTVAEVLSHEFSHGASG
jgi:acetyl esterase/lipase